MLDILEGHGIINHRAAPRESRKMVTIRQAQVADLDEVMVLANMFHEESNNGSPVPDADVVRMCIEACSKTTAVVFGLAVDEKKLVGIVLGHSDTFMWSWARQTTVQILYVLPEYRGTLLGKKLLGYAEKLARMFGSRYLYVSMNSKIHTARSERFMQLLGFNTLGPEMVKDI